MASQKMNSKTHKIITATYPKEFLYAVPIEWDIEEISIKYGTISYKGEEQDVPEEEYEGDYKYPDKIEESELDLEDYFDCEEEEEEEERYYCCDCGVELDRVRDGEEKRDFRCNNCYWEDKEGIDSKNMKTPDYRKQEEEEEEK
jgi:DNA-directed RNA polymerase subunit RPC12/RpoP